MIRNNNRSSDGTISRTNSLIDQACSDEEKERLAKLSEEANFALKNTYVHQNTTMQYADKKRMPIDSDKVRDILRNEHIVRHEMDTKIGTYTGQQMNNQFENGLLTYLNEVAWGDLRDLLKDVGINKDTIRFLNVSDAVKAKDNLVKDNDRNLRQLMNARMTQVDMTDYEDDFTGMGEIPGNMPIMDQNRLDVLMPERWP